MKLLFSSLALGFSLSLYGMNPNNQFVEALKRKDYKQAEDILRNAPQGTIDVNVNIKKGRTPLHLALDENNESLAELLIRSGANVNAQDKRGRQPLFSATSNDNERMVELLIRNDANVNARSNFGWTPLLKTANASSNQNPANTRIANLLIRSGANINIQNNYGDTPLLLAAQGGSIDLVKLLLSQGADASKTDNSGLSALPRAINLASNAYNFGLVADYNKYSEIVKLLDAYKASQGTPKLEVEDVTVQSLNL